MYFRVHASKFQSQIDTYEIDSIEMSTAQKWELLFDLGLSCTGM